MSALLEAAALKLVAGVMTPVVYFLSAGVRFYWLYLLSALVIAVLLFCLRDRPAGRFSPRALARYLWPKAVWLHPSALLDYRYVALDAVLFTVLVAPFIVSAYAISGQVEGALAGTFGPARTSAAGGVAVNLAYTLALLLAGDLARYLTHRLFHRVPMLWEFHKVHHSAEVLTPVTLFRIHPVERFCFGTATGAAAGLVTGVFGYLYPQELTIYGVLGINAGVFAFNLLGANLRHSHVWLSYGPLLERIFISPAQHQIHHSDAPQHFDRNFGSFLAVWDWAFGSLYLVRRREPLSFGLGREENARFTSLWRLYATPFRRLRAAARA